MTYDVQLTPMGAQIWLEDDLVLDLDIDEFKQLADAFADAALTAQGYESIACRAEEVQIGDMIEDRQVINVRPDHGGIGVTTINTKPFGWMMFQSDHMVTVDRAIQ